MIKHSTHLIAMIALIGGSLVVALAYTRQTTGAILLTILLGSAILLVIASPVLGPTVIPCAALQERIPEHADTTVTIGELGPGTKVIYWASEPATVGLATLKDWQKAYLDFANAGVATVDEAGRATLRVRKPQAYTVPILGRIESHVHWRSCQDGGLMGPVQTTPIAL
jgi:hypothetical protein